MTARGRKLEIDTPQALANWMANPVPAIFQGQDLTTILLPDKADLSACVFLGCRLPAPWLSAAVAARSLIMPVKPGLSFDPFSCDLYTPDELYDRFDPADPVNSYQLCTDYRIYTEYLRTDTDLDDIIFRRIHDWSIEEALDDLLTPERRKTTVAIMGGHDRERTDPLYRQIAHLTRTLTQQGYLIVTGGGPGLMEAANLGAYSAGFNDAAKLDIAIDAMKDAPLYNDKKWLLLAHTAWKAMGKPDDAARAENVGIPTWYYGHDPPNVFATRIAKYFENNIREDGLLAIAHGGVIFAEGNAGTVQEIFQDACQNYYRSVAKSKSPMILLDSAYWNPASVNFNNNFKATRKPKPAYPLLHRLATERGFDDYLLMTDDVGQVLEFLKAHPPVYTA